MIERNTPHTQVRHRLAMGLLVGAALAGVVALVWTLDPFDLWETESKTEDTPLSLQAETPKSPTLRATPAARPAQTKSEEDNDREPSVPEEARPKPWDDPTRTSAPGTLELLVVRNGKPAALGAAQLWRHDVTQPLDPRKTPARRGTWNSEGAIVFRDLARSVWVPSIRPHGGSTLYMSAVFISDTEPNRTVAFHIGERHISGTVYDHAGQPATDVPIVAFQPPGAPRTKSYTRTDSDGRYDLGALQKGAVAIWATLQDNNNTKTKYGRTAILNTDDIRDFSFGSQAGRHLIAGVVQCEDGTPVRGPGLSTCIGISTPGPYSTTQLRYDEHGRFEQHLDQGEYKVSLRAPLLMRPRTTLPLVLLGDQTALRWTLPGTRLLGRVMFHNGRVPHNGATLFVGSHRINPFRPDGSFTLYGLPPGSVRLRVNIFGRGFVTDEVLTIPPDTAEIEHLITLPTKKQR